MNLWKRIEAAVWTGRILREYPLAEDLYRAGVKRRVTALLTERDGKHRFMIRASFKAWFSASVQYVEFDRDAAQRLHAALGAALAEMPNREA